MSKKFIKEEVVIIITILIFCILPSMGFSIENECLSQINGDWIIKNETVCSNMEIILTGNLKIENNSLTLKNVILKINSSYNGQFFIGVYKNGLLYVENSTISAVNHNKKYNFWYYPESYGAINYSVIEDLSGPRIHHKDLEKYCPPTEDCNSSEGLFIGADNFIIEDSIIQNSNRHGLNIRAKNVTIRNNIIRNNFCENINVEGNERIFLNGKIHNNEIYGSSDCNGINLAYGEFEIYNNSVHDNEFNGIESAFSNVTIYDNIFENNGDNGVNNRHNSSTVVYRNTIKNNAHNGIFLDWNLKNQIHIFNNYIVNNSISGITVYSTSNVMIENNTIKENWIGIKVANIHSFFGEILIPNSTKNVTVRSNKFIDNKFLTDIKGDTEVFMTDNIIEERNNYQVIWIFIIISTILLFLKRDKIVKILVYSNK